MEIFQSSQLFDETATRILDWLLESSRDTLLDLPIAENNLTRIPADLCSFSELRYVNVKKNQISLISANSFCSTDNETIRTGIGRKYNI